MTSEISIRIVESLRDISAESWDACAGLDNPFLSHAFLNAIEESGSATARAGWAPHHLLAETAGGELLACAPLYLKSHSYGEYVFDWGWAEAWQRAGKEYYPKLQCAVPFTPVTGPRLLVRPELNETALAEALADTMSQLVERNQLSSAHVTFSTEEEARMLTARGWLLRMGEQYHWQNDNYRSFDDFLAALSSRKRKNIRKEREQAASHGLEMKTLVGEQITKRHWDSFHRFYLDTIGRKWGEAYLTRDFFTRLGRALGDRVVMMVAESKGAPVAGALNLLGRDALYGRNWGADGEFKFLHFELCYYRAIDFAIERGLPRVEAGAQGSHKISRGYVPMPTWSAHWIREGSFRRAVARFLDEERLAVQEKMQDHAAAAPFKETAANED